MKEHDDLFGLTLARYWLALLARLFRCSDLRDHLAVL